MGFGSMICDVVGRLEQGNFGVLGLLSAAGGTVNGQVGAGMPWLQLIRGTEEAKMRELQYLKVCAAALENSPQKVSLFLHKSTSTACSLSH